VGGGRVGTVNNLTAGGIVNLLDYLPADFLNRIGLPQVSYPVANNPASIVAPADPQRVILIFGNGGASGVTLSTDPLVNNSTHPGVLSAGGPASMPVILTYWINGPIVCAAWFGFAGGAVIPVLTQSLLPNADAGNAVPLPVRPQPPAQSAKPVSGRLATIWAQLTGRKP
jgi:hypothetical protein